jgi:glutaminase
LGLRDELRRIGVEAVMVDPAHAVLPLDSDASKRIRHFPDCNASIEYVEDALIAAYGGADTHWGPIQPQDHPLIAGLPDDLMTMLRSRLVPCSYADGEPLVLAGQPAKGLFLVLAGMVNVSVESGDVRHHLSMFTVGTTFGVVYAVAGRGYDIDAHAVDAVEALLLPIDDLVELNATEPGVMLVLLQRLVTGAFDSLDWVTRALVTPN